jgi:hypothetical protein
VKMLVKSAYDRALSDPCLKVLILRLPLLLSNLIVIVLPKHLVL